MAMYIVADLCIGCGDCEAPCPTTSITEKSGIFVIDPQTCTECEGDHDAPKCVEVCPIDDCILPLAS